jgi:hypothetical protein
MAIALVKAGTIVTATGTSVAPAFGQATAAGNLLVACLVTITGGAYTLTISDGTWTRVSPTDSNSTHAAIFYKQNCGAGETAPTLNASTTVTLWGVLSEWSGADITAPFDKGMTTANEDVNPIIASAADGGTSNVAIAAFSWTGSKSATATFGETWSPASGTTGTLGDTGSTKGAAWASFPYYLLNTHGGGAADQDTETCTPSTGVSTFSKSVIATFKPQAAAAFIASKPFVTPNQAVQRAVTRFSALIPEWRRKTRQGLLVPDLAVI